MTEIYAVWATFMLIMILSLCIHSSYVFAFPSIPRWAAKCERISSQNVNEFPTPNVNLAPQFALYWEADLLAMSACQLNHFWSDYCSFLFVKNTQWISLFLDIPECSFQAEAYPCHVRADCTESFGSYSCQCKDGYTGDGLQCTSNYVYHSYNYSTINFMRSNHKLSVS